MATSGLHGGARKRFGGSARLFLTPIFVVYLALKTVSVNLTFFKDILGGMLVFHILMDALRGRKCDLFEFVQHVRVLLDE